VNYKLIGSLVMPYLMIGILGTVAGETYSSSPSGDDALLNTVLDVQIASSDEADANNNAIQGGFSFITDATGNLFGWTKYIYSVSTLNYSWWSKCKESNDFHMGYENGTSVISGTPRIESTGECYENIDGTIEKGAPLAFRLVRWIIVIMGIPALVVLGFKSAELFARFIQGVGSSIGGLTNLVRGWF
jgi:hypothetical protein|tara:strand:- start:1020 stop:1583 length:564 start_codon:yes stop_codon:yes gene_type:complete